MHICVPCSNFLVDIMVFEVSFESICAFALTAVNYYLFFSNGILC